MSFSQAFSHCFKCAELMCTKLFFQNSLQEKHPVPKGYNFRGLQLTTQA